MNRRSSFYHNLLGALDRERHMVHRLSLLLVIALGFLLRLYSLEVGEAYRDFTINDEVSAFKKAFELLAGHAEAFFIGQPAFAGGRAPGPLWSLFTAGAYFLGGQSIQGALAVMAIFNTITIFLIYILARQFLSAGLALFTAFLFATAPIPIHYAVGFYNPIPLAFFSALLFIALHKVFWGKRSRQVFWVLLLLAVLPQFHMIAVFFAPAVLILLYLTPGGLNWRWLGFGAVAGFALYVPYLIGDGLNGWQNTRAMLGGDDKAFSFSVMKILTTPPGVLSNVLGRAPGDEVVHYQHLGNQYFLHYSVLLVINVVSFVLCAGLFLYYGYRYFGHVLGRLLRRTANGDAMEVVFFGTLLYVPLLLFFPTGHNYASRYAIILFPLLFLLPALVISRAPDAWLGRILRRSFLGLAFVNIYIVIALYDYRGERLEQDSDFMPSFATLAEIERKVDRHAGDQVAFDVTYSKAIKALPEDQYKLYRAVEHYLNLQPVRPKDRVRLLFDLPAGKPGDGAEVLYRSRHLQVTRSP